MSYAIQQIAGFIATKSLPKFLGDIEYLVVDSRKIVFPKTSLFFALTTARNDGHNFIEMAYTLGVRNFVVQKTFDETPFADANFLKTHDVLKALQDVAANHRKQFVIPVIGITGSNGKTIVKEWLYELLKDEYNIVRSPRSYNSQIGVPLSVWQMNSSHTLAIFEAGISEVGEMQWLANVIKPTIGVLTTIGSAHDDGFKSRQNKLEEKLLLFKTVDTLIIENDSFYEEKLSNINIKNIFSYGENENCTLTIIEQKSVGQATEIKAKYFQEQLSLIIPFVDEASIHNCCTCWATMLHLSFKQETIQEKILQLQPLEMRMKLEPAINNCTLINDSYSNDSTAFMNGLDFFIANAGDREKIIILSDFASLKNNDYDTYSQLIFQLQQRNINCFIGIGNALNELGNDFKKAGIKCFMYPSTNDFLQQFAFQQLSNSIIYLKGARSFAFEKIAKILQQRAHQTVMEVNLTALTHNLKQFQHLLKPKIKTMAMVKAFSYGSGSEEIARILQFNKVDYLAVAYTDEGIELRKAGISLPILVLNIEHESFEALIEYNLEPEIFSFSIYEAFDKYLKRLAITHFPIHLKANTGMNRLGFDVEEAKEISNKIASNKTMMVKSVFSHLVGSESENFNDFTLLQQQQFDAFCEVVHCELKYDFIKHISNTAAIISHPNLQYDMVRLGIGLYGLKSFAHKDLNLQVVATLKTTIAQIRIVKKGESVGYNRKSIIDKDSKIAVIRIGYADGFSRQLSNGKGMVFVKDKLAPIIGNICMDMTMINITEINDVREGDIVEIFGNNLAVNQVATWSGTIAYETLSTVNQRVKRVYFQE